MTFFTDGRKMCAVLAFLQQVVRELLEVEFTHFILTGVGPPDQFDGVCSSYSLQHLLYQLHALITYVSHLSVLFGQFLCKENRYNS